LPFRFPDVSISRLLICVNQRKPSAKPALDFQHQFFKEPLFSPPERPFVPESVSICGQIYLNPRKSALIRGSF
jgi:hypothetical protein